MSPLTKEQINEFDTATLCHICGKLFEQGDEKVRDHDHLISENNFRGAAHSVCNLNYKIQNYLPIVLHNLSNYDCHLFIKKLCMNEERIDVIAQNKEKYISFSKYLLVEKSNDSKAPNVYMKLRFVDSFRFLASSLDKLSETLKSDQCNEVRKHFPNEEEFRLIRQKGVFPYTYVNSFEKLNETWLPNKECFYDNLKGEPVSDEDYKRASEVWTIFKCTTLGSYSDVYLKSDVLLLADIFENFRKVCLKQYNLDPAHYLTAPSLSWDAMLRYTKIELELLVDIDMIHFFKKGIRGGVSQCSKRKVVANNSFVSNYDPLQPNAYIMYLDATNLYGAAMSNYLPTGGFRWLENCDNFDCFAIADDSFKGYVLEVDLDYPTNLHNIHNDLPFCPEPIKTSNNQYTKLVPNLYDKKKVHHSLP
ncbi:uncharacterized protein [Diabrotica undecimpunctata]|uniref:uncharacterized protein n=1 Tax=Diabrotica undecimpunctata TaxID=50387 RepID=UPI003B63E1B4